MFFATKKILYILIASTVLANIILHNRKKMVSLFLTTYHASHVVSNTRVVRFALSPDVDGVGGDVAQVLQEVVIPLVVGVPAIIAIVVAVLPRNLFGEKLFDNSVKGLIVEGVDPEGKARTQAVCKSESCQPSVLVHDHIAVLEDEVELEE